MQFDHRIVKESFDKARPIAVDVLTKFFEILFFEYPAIGKLFENTDLDVLKPRMVKSLVLIMNNLENPDQLRPYLKDLGTRHTTYAVRPEHHDAFRDSFLKSLEYFFGEDWTGPLSLNWGAAFEFILDVMQPAPQHLQIPFPKGIKREIPDLNSSFISSTKIQTNSDAKLPINIGNMIKSVEVPDLSAMPATAIHLPDELLQRIRDAATAMVRKAIESELETAMERELKKYMDKGIADLLKKSS
jgi:hemoglobin-like flavoprotein